MKIWIDALTPKQALFFNVVKGWLNKKGHEVFSTTRAGYGGHELGSIVNYNLEIIGKHGLTPFEKLIESSRRIKFSQKLSAKEILTWLYRFHLQNVLGYRMALEFPI